MNLQINLKQRINSAVALKAPITTAADDKFCDAFF